MSWKATRAAAMKILGKKGQVPDLAPAITKGIDKVFEGAQAFADATEQYGDALRELEDANSALEHALEDFTNVVNNTDFSMDADAHGNQTLIGKARSAILAVLANQTAALEKSNKDLEEADKHLIQMGKYKPPAVAL